MFKNMVRVRVWQRYYHHPETPRCGLYLRLLLKGSIQTPVLQLSVPASSTSTPTSCVVGSQEKTFPRRVSEKTSLSFHHPGPKMTECPIFLPLNSYLLSKPWHLKSFPIRPQPGMVSNHLFHDVVETAYHQVANQLMYFHKNLC